MPTTIVQVTADANSLYTGLTSDLTINLDLPELNLDTSWDIPALTGLPTVAPLTIEQLTSGTVEGSGVFDALMKAVDAHLTQQHLKNRITGADYAKVYLGAMTAVMQFGTQYLLGKDRAHLENLALLENLKLAQAQTIKAQAEVQLIAGQIQIAMFQAAEMRLRAYTARNQYAASKMDLVLGYNNILDAESKQKLTFATYENMYAQTRDTLPNGDSVNGVVGTERVLKEKQGLLVHEQMELARSEIRDTLSTGGAFAGMAAIKKLVLEAQRQLTNEQVDTQRAQTKDTLLSGGPILGIAAKEKAFTDAKAKLTGEQYESQRGQTRGTLSTGETVVGILGAQTRLYEQQITSYKRDAESKGVKMLLDTWVARKTIDEGVAVPAAIDSPALNTLVTTFRSNLDM